MTDTTADAPALAPETSPDETDPDELGTTTEQPKNTELAGTADEVDTAEEPEKPEPGKTPSTQDTDVESTPEEPQKTSTEQPDEPETDQVEDTETTQEPAKPSYSSVLSKWLAYRFGGSARRMLMSVGVLKQEDDAMTDIGGAGNGMACSDDDVTQVLPQSFFPCSHRL